MSEVPLYLLEEGHLALGGGDGGEGALGVFGLLLGRLRLSLLLFRLHAVFVTDIYRGGAATFKGRWSD